MQTVRRPGARGLFRSWIREATARVADVSFAIPHIHATTRGDRDARAAGIARPLSPIDLEFDRRGAAQGDRFGLRRKGRVGSRP